ncbi:MAG: phosphatidylglycerophosphatase A [Candidatus Aminicenantes bacterium]|nr:phosphatidylglycerophosphatase A [Candidatus Aminicenantes bacterium]MDH5715646.1 phosphatidylglycerophosphatase A [Candidatus Aminicenantes bacterium]
MKEQNRGSLRSHPRTLKEHLIFLIATWFYVGYSPIAPGTIGSVTAIPLLLLIALFASPLVYCIIVLILLVIAVFVSYKAEGMLCCQDPSQIVIDEVVGFLATMVFIPLGWKNIMGGLLIFRLMDITKPFPVGRAEALKRGVGVVADDFVAAVYANIILRIIMRFFP